MKRRDDLTGVTVIVTRPERQSRELCRAVEERGGRTVVYPAMVIEPVRPSATARRVLESLRAGDWAVFISPNAVRLGLQWFPGDSPPAGVRVAAVGRSTARALERLGIGDVLVPDVGSDSEALLDRLSEEPISGRRMVLIKGRGGRRALGPGLRRRGARVTAVAVYRRQRPVAPGDGLARLLPERGKVVTTVTSGEILNNLVHMIDADTLRRLKRCPLVTVSERVAGLARWSGFERVRVAAGPGPDEVARAVAGATGNG